MIVNFKCEETAKIFRLERSRKFPADIQATALRRLVALQAANNINDLRQPSGNRLEKLTGNRAGQYSIRINDQWRICFVWQDGNAHAVEIVDYH